MTSDPGEDRARRESRLSRRTEAMRLTEQDTWCRLADAVRRQVEACVELDAMPETMVSLAEQAERLAERLEAEASGKRFELVEAAWDGTGDALNYLPFSPIMGRLNPASYGLDLHREGDRAIGEVVLNETAEGAVGLAHGGVISGIWDEVLAAANAIQRTGGPTGRLTIRYRRPTPLHEPLRYAAWVERIEERKVLVKGICTLRAEPEGQVLTEAEGIFVRIRHPGIDWHRPDEAADPA